MKTCSVEGCNNSIRYTANGGGCYKHYRFVLGKKHNGHKLLYTDIYVCDACGTSVVRGSTCYRCDNPQKKSKKKSIGIVMLKNFWQPIGEQK